MGASMGFLRAFRYEPTAVGDIIPVDFCVNLMLVAAWHRSIIKCCILFSFVVGAVGCERRLVFCFCFFCLFVCFFQTGDAGDLQLRHGRPEAADVGRVLRPGHGHHDELSDQEHVLVPVALQFHQHGAAHGASLSLPPPPPPPPLLLLLVHRFDPSVCLFVCLFVCIRLRNGQLEKYVYHTLPAYFIDGARALTGRTREVRVRWLHRATKA